MRTIKFRAWDGKYMEEVPDIIELWDNSSYAYAAPYKPILLQFTGLHDKNGKEIYEGDIIHFIGNKMEADSNWHDDPRTDVVVWDDKESAFYIGEINYLGYLVSTFECEIIGNIYKNPELLN